MTSQHNNNNESFPLVPCDMIMLFGCKDPGVYLVVSCDAVYSEGFHLHQHVVIYDHQTNQLLTYILDRSDVFWDKVT
jgi:hypothetical protein